MGIISRPLVPTQSETMNPPPPTNSPPPPSLPFHTGNTHQHLLVLNRDPARKDFHRVFEIRVEEDVAGAGDEGGGGGVQDVEAAGGGGLRMGGGGGGVAEEHEDVPDAELGGEGDGVVEEGEVPAGAVGGGGDVEVGLVRWKGGVEC